MNQVMRNELERLSRRVHAFNASGVAGFGTDEGSKLEKFFEDLSKTEVKAGADAETIRTALDALKNGDDSQVMALNEIRTVTINNYIRGTANFLETFYEPVTLGPADRPAIQNETMQEINISYLGQDGEAKVRKAIAPQEEVLLDLRIVTSEKFRYHLVDLYNGNVSANSQRTVDIAFDLKNKLDLLGFQLLEASVANGGAFGSFVTTGNKVRRTFTTNSRILSGNLPTTNALTTTGASGATTFDPYKVVRSIISYTSLWQPLTGLAPTGIILVPSIDVQYAADVVSATAAATNDTQLLKDYTSFDYLGRRWTFVPDATIATGACYPLLNKPVGKVFWKPSMNKSFTNTNEEQNWEERSSKVVIGLSIREQWRVNALRVRYNTSWSDPVA